MIKNKSEANLEFSRRRQKSLRENKSALKWLYEQGLVNETISYFGLGLAGLYIDREKVPHENALLAPVMDKNANFTKQTIYINVPEITVHPANTTSWVKGAPNTYYAEKYSEQTLVMVCESVWDVWLTRQALRQDKSEINLLLICPTTNDPLPEEWHSMSFWNRFETIYLGHSNTITGDKIAIHIAEAAGCETRRLRSPLNFGKSWAKFWQNKGSVKEFYRILSDAGVMSDSISVDVDNGNRLGRFGYQPVDIAIALHRGHLYYPVKTILNSLETYKDFKGEVSSQITARTEVVVVRSDRTIHTAKEDPAPRGTPPEDRILRLTDGTLIDSIPKASRFSTWSWGAIEAYQQKSSKTRSLRKILADIKDFLKRSVWLPHAYDYDLLTLLVPVTFAQAVFQAVPMVLVVGEAGSGKSALGKTMCRICANAVSVGQISAAAVARLIHETKGFIVLDDLESIGKRSKRDSSQFSELIQALKLSYNKETSWKVWTDVSRGMRVARLNFFGVKMINNTSGTDDILGSRMLKIYTGKIPAELQSRIGIQNIEYSMDISSLRDELHTWTFENVALIDATYKRSYPRPSDRAAEISAPLRVFAEIAEDNELLSGLETALKIKSQFLPAPEDPIETMIRAVKKLVRLGFREISTTHVVLEMKAMSSLIASESHKFGPAKWENPAWVGRHLRTYNLVDINAGPDRQWLYGKSLRIYPVRKQILEEVFTENTVPFEQLEKKPLDFCQGCENCSYRFVGCSIMTSRLAAEKNNSSFS